MTNFRELRKQGMPAGLDFRVEMPFDWVDVPMPDESHDFDDPLHMASVAVMMAPWAAIVFAVAARPAYAEGTVAQWLEWASRQRGIDPGTMEHQQLGPHQAAGCWGIQIEDGSVMRARVAMFEDGDRIIVVNCMAPDALWASVAATFAHMLNTFALLEPRGGRFALAPADAPLAATSMTTGGTPTAVAPTAPPAAPERGPLPLPGDEDGAGDESMAAAPEVQAIAVALAADQATFEPEHPVNVRMRERGAGTVPDVMHYDEQERWAGLAPASLRATIRVPFGWHVVDDTRRTLVLDATGNTQVSLRMLPRAGRSDDAILMAMLPELLRKWPAMRHLRTAAYGMECLLVRDAVMDGQPIEQAFVLRQGPGDLVLQVHVTSTPAKFKNASDLTELLLRDLQFADALDALDPMGR